MTGDDFLDVATSLLAQPGVNEAIQRTIVSRAYYGAFHTARGFLTELGFSVTRDHGLPVRWLMVCGEANAREAGKVLSELQGERVKADYDLATPRFCQRSLVKELVDQAREVQRLISACKNEPARAVIKAGIEAYQKKIAGKP